MVPVVGLRFPPRDWLATALIPEGATSSGVLRGAYLAAIRDFESDHHEEGPLRGPSIGTGGRTRTDTPLGGNGF